MRSMSKSRGIQYKAHVKRLLQEFTFIRGLNTVIQEEVAGIVNHESRKAGDVLWRQGDPPDDGCYVILQGEVQIWRSNVASGKAPELEIGSHAVQRHASIILNLLEDEKETQEEQKDKIQNRSHQRRNQKKKQDKEASDGIPEVHVATLGVGVMFGEVALLENQTRHGTFKCAKLDCEFLHITKKDFDRLLKHSMNQIRSKQLSGPMRAFLRQFDFFQKLDNPVQVRVPEIMHYQRYKAGSVVFRESDPPTCLYIILQGVVAVVKEGVDASTDNLAVKAGGWEEQSTVMRIKAAAMLERLHEREDYTHQHNWVDSAEVVSSIDSLGGVIAKLGPAGIFGELALIENEPRSASVVCESNCEFLSVDRDDFNALLKDAIAETHAALPELVEPLLSKIPFFAAFRAAVRENVAYCMRYYVEQKGQVLFWEGDPPGSCYLLLDGEVSVWKKQGDDTMAVIKEQPLVTAGQDICDHSGLVARHLAGVNRPMHFSDLKGDILDMVKKTKDNVDSVNKHAGSRKLKRCDTSSNIQDILGLQVAHLGQGCVFGEAALVENMPRNATCICETTCQLLVINKPDFDRVVKQDLLRVKVKQLAGAIKRLLREFDLFKELSPAVQDQLADIIHYWKAREGTLLFEQGDSPNYCYIILSGEVTIWKPRPKEEIEVAPQRAGSKDTNGEGQNRVPNRLSAISVASIHERKRPPVEIASELARERCASLAHILAAVSDYGMSTQSGEAQGRHTEDDTMVRFTSDPVAALGSGTLFGELGLLNDQPRGNTVSCWKDCEFLLIEKDDFDRLLKAELNKTKEEKLKFLRTHVPGVRSLQPTLAERLLYYFNKETVPRNHVFIKQGQILQGDIYFVWDGSVESYANLPNGAFRRRGILLRGSIFAATPTNTAAQFTVVATSSPCEVLHVKPEFRKHIPESVLASVREQMELTLVRRNGQCTPLIPVLPDVHHTLQRPSSQPSGQQRRRKTCLMPASQDLFQRAKTEQNFSKLFQFTPGATVNGRPKPQQNSMHGMHISSSAPVLGAAAFSSSAPLLSH